MEPRYLAVEIVGAVVPYLRGDDHGGPDEAAQGDLWLIVRPRLAEVMPPQVMDRLADDRAAQAEAARALARLLADDRPFAERVEAALRRIRGRPRNGEGRRAGPSATPPAGERRYRSPGPPPWGADSPSAPRLPPEDANELSPAPPPPPQAAPPQAAPPQAAPRKAPPPPAAPPPAAPRASVPASRSGTRGRPSLPSFEGIRDGLSWRRRGGPRRSRPRADVPPAERPAPGRLVSTGVAVRRRRVRVLPPRTALGADGDYLYWFAVGTPREHRVDVGPRQFLPLVAAAPGTRLKVILFPFADGLLLDPGADMGELEYQADGRLAVARQPVDGLGAGDDDRLWFPFRTPREPGTYRLRSSVYLGARLLQSRVLEVRVARWQRPVIRPAVASTTDYSVCQSLREEVIREMRPPRVSVLLNDGPNGSHDFRFVGADGNLRGTASLDADTLQRLLAVARKALGRAAWGTTEQWCDSDTYRYDPPRPTEDVQADLVSMARAGYRIWDALADALERSVAGQLPVRADAHLTGGFTALLARSGAVELACRESLRLAVPSALVYDYPLDTQLQLRFCPTAAEAIFDRDGDLTAEPCFDGRCPDRETVDVVCPGGFWGYRHELGVPVSLAAGDAGDASDIAPQIKGADSPVFVVGTTTDDAFTRRLAHLGRLQQLHVPIDWRLGEKRDAVIGLLRDSAPHVVYFLCHGVETADGLPGLLVGDPRNEVAITPDNLRLYGIAWPQTRPLVVLNGCRTTALDPTKPWNFVETFVRKAYASGVIGTEITVFEPLACDFAEEVLQRFVHDDVTLGRAVRESRLSLLRRGNPLGLAYVPYAPTELHMA